MASSFPSRFVDQKTGTIEKFQTMRERVTGEFLPEAGHVGILAVKLAVLAPFVGGLVVAAPVVAVAWFGARWGAAKVIDLVHEKLLLEHKKGDFIEFDFTKADDVAAFSARYGDRHAQFAQDYAAMTKLAGLPQPPKVFIIDQFFKKGGTSKLGGLVSDFMAGTTSRPNGKDPVIMLGKGALNELTAGELRAVVAHEMTHLNLQHPAKGVRWQGRMPVNALINVALVGAALLGPLPLLPVLGFVAVTNVAGRALKAIQSRHHEKLCDRGAALITGGTGDLTTALEKIKHSMLKMQRIETEYAYRSKGLEPPEQKEAGAVKRFFVATHPANEVRSSLLQQFEKKYPAWCEKQRGYFSNAFNKAAARPDGGNAAPLPANANTRGANRWQLAA
ncbi:MAG: M48 family metalloprotease [Micavibrio sp.]|nr:M48 family metalloprotease [Micavibrio sp.]